MSLCKSLCTTSDLAWKTEVEPDPATPVKTYERKCWDCGYEFQTTTPATGKWGNLCQSCLIAEVV